MRTTKKLNNYLVPFSRQFGSNMSGVYFPRFAISEVIDIAKYEYINSTGLRPVVAVLFITFLYLVTEVLCLVTV